MSAALALAPDAPPEAPPQPPEDLPITRHDGPPVEFTVGREDRTPPPEAAAAATRIGGLNLYGEPRFRLVWSDSRVETQGGEWYDVDRSGNFIRRVVGYRTVFRYHVRSRWILEAWYPAERYGSPEDWRRTNALVIDGISLEPLGDYPSRGDYEIAFIFDHPIRGYVEPTRERVEELIRAAFRGVALSREELGRRVARAHHAAQEREDAEQQEQLRLSILEQIPRIDKHTRAFITSTAGREVPRL